MSLTSSRPGSLEEKRDILAIGGGGGRETDRRSRTGADNDLMDYLRQSPAADENLGEFDRNGSIRRRSRRSRTPLEGVVSGRERSTPPLNAHTPEAGAPSEFGVGGVGRTVAAPASSVAVELSPGNAFRTNERHRQWQTTTEPEPESAFDRYRDPLRRSFTTAANSDSAEKQFMITSPPVIKEDNMSPREALLRNGDAASAVARSTTDESSAKAVGQYREAVLRRNYPAVGNDIGDAVGRADRWKRRWTTDIDSLINYTERAGTDIEMMGTDVRTDRSDDIAGGTRGTAMLGLASEKTVTETKTLSSRTVSGSDDVIGTLRPSTTNGNASSSRGDGVTTEVQATRAVRIAADDGKGTLTERALLEHSRFRNSNRDVGRTEDGDDGLQTLLETYRSNVPGANTTPGSLCDPNAIHLRSSGNVSGEVQQRSPNRRSTEDGNLTSSDAEQSPDARKRWGGCFDDVKLTTMEGVTEASKKSTTAPTIAASQIVDVKTTSAYTSSLVRASSDVTNPDPSGLQRQRGANWRRSQLCSLEEEDVKKDVSPRRKEFAEDDVETAEEERNRNGSSFNRSYREPESSTASMRDKLAPEVVRLRGSHHRILPETPKEPAYDDVPCDDGIIRRDSISSRMPGTSSSLMSGVYDNVDFGNANNSGNGSRQSAAADSVVVGGGAAAMFARDRDSSAYRDESVAGVVDEGFESGSLSDQSASQRTSKASSMAWSDISMIGGSRQQLSEIGGVDEADDNNKSTGTYLFSRSIDSLVSKQELTAVDIDIAEDATGNDDPSMMTTIRDGERSRSAASLEPILEAGPPLISDFFEPEDAAAKSTGRPVAAAASAITVVGAAKTGPTKARSGLASTKSTLDDITARLSRPKKFVPGADSSTRSTTDAASKSVVSSHPTPPVDQFVRFSKLRSTLPAKMGKTKSTAAAAAAAAAAAPEPVARDVPAAADADEQQAPEPPRRTTSIRAADRLSLGLPASFSANPRRSTVISSSTSTTAGGADKKPTRFGNNFVMNRLRSSMSLDHASTTTRGSAAAPAVERPPLLDAGARESSKGIAQAPHSESTVPAVARPAATTAASTSSMSSRQSLFARLSNPRRGASAPREPTKEDPAAVHRRQQLMSTLKSSKF